jgi:peptide/nickel transport system substrate-binding protein
MRLSVAALLAALIPFTPAAAQDGTTLNIATGGAFTSLDPHYHNLTPNNVLADYLYGALVSFGPTYDLNPGLALSWKVIEPTVWEFKLRPGVKFSDGTPFTADDVVFTFNRIPNVLNSPSSFNSSIKPITQIEVIDPLTIHFHTAQPVPLLPYLLAQARIISKHAAEGASTADFNSGKAAVGAGPYKLVSVSLGDKVVMHRNEDWYGPKPAWDNVVYRVIANDAARSAALQSGDVDIIDQVPTRDVANLRANPKLNVMSAAGPRLIYIYLDAGRAKSPQVFDLDGKPLDKNPLQDARVRKALSLAINREGIKTQIMDGFSKPTGQLVGEGMSGYDPAIKPPPYDPAEAKRLLSEAGYPNGFAITLNGPNDRYVNDHTIEEAIAQMWTRIGVKTSVDSKPASVFFAAGQRDEYSADLIGWSSDTGEASSPLVTIVASSIPEKGWGGYATFHASHFSDPAVDAIIEKSLMTIDTEAREALYREATEKAMDETPVIPLHNQVNVWASRKGISMTVGLLEGTRAWWIKPDGT